MKPAGNSGESGTGVSPVSASIPILLFILALLIRLPAFVQCLWYDEMFTFLHYIRQPWGDIVSGHYSPNNHVLFTLLAKVCDILFSSSLNVETAIRLPSLLAGAAVAPLLAIPLLKRQRGHALLLGILAAVHPWLLSFSAWARGYALLMLLAVAATPTLTTLIQRWGDLTGSAGLGVEHRTRTPRWVAANAYILLIAALLYTHPIGIAIAVGHGAYMLLPSNRSALRKWLLLIVPAAALTILLYLPFMTGARQYWSAPEKPTVSYGGFLAQALRHAHSGMDTGGIGAILITLLVCTAGPALAWRKFALLRPLIVTFATASAFALLAPIAIKLAGEARAALWLIPLYCIGLFGLLAAIPRFWVAAAGWGLALLVLGLRVYAISTTPGQPITDALAFVAQEYPKSTPTIGVYMSSFETKTLYDHLDALAYSLHDQPGSPGLVELIQTLPRRYVLVVFYEELLQRDQPELANYIHSRYSLAQVFPGRVSGIRVYVSR